MIASRGKLLLGARPLAQHIFDDEEKFRSVYNEDLQRELGLFMLGKRVAGYTGVIDARLNAKIVGKPDPASRPKALRPARSRGAGLFDSVSPEAQNQEGTDARS